MAELDFLQPFVMAVPTVEPERHGDVDLYLPASDQPTGVPPAPAIVVVHGGPLPAAVRPTPRDWPVYRAYAMLVANRGAVGVVVDHRLHSPADYAGTADRVAIAIEMTRADPRVDADRVALWFFSGGGLLLADWLRTPPHWLRCVAASYPVLDAPEAWGVEKRFQPVEAVGPDSPPIVLTRVGLESPQFAGGVEAFVAAAQARASRLTVVDVPHGRHSFDVLDDADESRAAITQATDAVFATLV